MSYIPNRENLIAEEKRLQLRESGMQPIGWIFIDPVTGRRATLDYFGRVQWWEIDRSGRMHAQAARIAELEQHISRVESERGDLRAARDEAWARIEKLESEIAVDDKLLAERDRLLNTIPACPAHGAGCVPHAIAWVDDARDRMGLNSEGEG